MTHIIEQPVYECFNCGNTYTREEIERAGGFVPDCDDFCPSCGEDAPICLIGSNEWAYHISCRAAAFSAHQIDTALEALPAEVSA